MRDLRAATITVGVASLAVACTGREPITSCAQDLHGVWQTEAGARWMVLDARASLEIYPLFDDGKPPGVPPQLEVAPRVIDLERTADNVHGEVQRRFMQGAEACVSIASVRVTSCTRDVLELVLSDPPPPVGFDPCSFPRPDSSRRERWHRSSR